MLSSNDESSRPSHDAVPSSVVKTLTVGGVSVRLSLASSAVQYLVRSFGSSVTMSAGPSVGSGSGSTNGRVPLFSSPASNGVLMGLRFSLEDFFQPAPPPV